MDVFALRDRVVDDYKRYIESFVRIRDKDIDKFVREQFDSGKLWPDPILQLNPAYEPGPTLDELAAQGVITVGTARFFRKHDGSALRLYRHQQEAIEIACHREPYVVTTGTGSGKSLTYLVPIYDHILRTNPEKHQVRAIIVYPMNALINSQLKALQDYETVAGESLVKFARYTGQEGPDSRQHILDDPPHILLTNYVMLEYMLLRPAERQFTDHATANLEYLVLDELHTYRGRKGADVAMLLRRLRERAGNPDLLHIGTSATMVTVSQENKAGVWKNGYAAVWHFGSSTSLSPSDSTANANNATNNGVTPTAGLFGGAGSFDGTGNTYLRIPSNSSFKPTAAITLEAWVNMAVAGANYQDILSLDYNANGSWSTPYRAYGMGFNNNSLVPWFDLAVSGGQLPIGPSAIANGQWTQVVGTYDGNNVVLYTNGSPVVTTPQTGPISYGTSQDLAVGIRSPYSPGEPVKGLIDEVRISTVARSAGWIATGYANESSPSTFYAVDGPVTAGSAPTIQNLLPSAGSSGDVVTIQGGGFESSQGGSTVTFNGLPATPTTWNDASIVVLVPAGATSGNVVVTVNGAASNAVPFTVPPPNITSLSPSSGVEGTQVAITGRNFGNPQGSSTVSFNGTPAAPIDWSDTNIIVPVPAGGTTGNVVVTVTGTASNGVTFTVVPGTGTTALSDSMGRNTNYGYQNIGGRNFMTSIVGTGCASCGGRGNTTLTYDPLGNVLSSTDALNNTTSYTYDSMGNVLSKTQYLNPTTPMTWSYTYNAFQEVLTARDPLGNVTTNVYDASGNLLSTTTPPPSGSGSGLTTNFQYNTLGELTQVTDPKGNRTTMTYTSAGVVASVTDARGNTTTFTYDGRGNRLASVDALNNTTSYTYDVMNRLTKITAPDTTYTQFAYDYRGRRISVTDANGKTTSYQYDDADRLVAVTDAASNVTVYGYDTENNMVDITDAASHQTSFAYDALGRVTAVTFPSTLSESYTYDGMNNLLSKTDRKEQTISYGYDALYRLTSKTYPDQTAVNYTYDPLSRLTQVTDPTGAYSFTYDNLGRLLGTGTQYSFFSSALNNSYGYDPASNRVSFSSSESGMTNYSYDSLNRLTSLADPNTGSFGFGYDALGRRTSLTRPNGVNTSYSYDILSRLLSVLHNGGTLPGSAGYTYDAAGNRLTKTAVQEASPNPVSVLSQYSYDNIYELTQAVVNGSATEGYSYDAVGNRLTSAGPTSYNYNTSNELTSTSAATYAYDNNGNTTSKTDSTGTTSYTWDYENRLASLTLPGAGGTVNFKYDPFARRIEKTAPTSGTTIYAYEGDDITEELGAGGNLLAHYTQGAASDEPLAITGTGGTYFYHADGLGSITSLTDGTGNVAANYVFDSFGKLTASTGTITNPFQYTGRELDSETGLYYYRARYYDPAVGRFTSEDPIGFWGGTNFYPYVVNDPTELTDPTGESPCLNIQKFVNFMNRQAAGKTNSTRNCAQAVKNGLDAGFGGQQGESLHGGPHNYGKGLQILGFKSIANSTPYKPGDVMIFQPPGTNPNGHIQTWNGSQWVSDYMQPAEPNGYPGPGGPTSQWQQQHAAYQLYRDFNPCP